MSIAKPKELENWAIWVKKVYVIFISQKNIPPLFCVFSAPHPVEGCCHLLFDAWSKIVLYVLYFFDLIACSLYFCWYFYFRLAGGYTWAQKRNVSFLGKIWSKFNIGFLVSFRPNWSNKPWSWSEKDGLQVDLISARDEE